MRVLIVDDRAADAELMERTLQANGMDTYRVETITDATEALKVYDPDLVLLDLNMPDFAWQMTLPKVVKDLKRDGVLVVVTVLISDRVIKACKDALVDAVIDKELVRTNPKSFFLKVKTALLNIDEDSPRVARLQEELSRATALVPEKNPTYSEAQNEYLIKSVDRIDKKITRFNEWKATVDARHGKEDKYFKVLVTVVSGIFIELAAAGIHDLFFHH